MEAVNDTAWMLAGVATGLAMFTVMLWPLWITLACFKLLGWL